MQSSLKTHEVRHRLDRLNALMSVATSHADPAIRLVASVLAEFCEKSAAEFKERRFREGMARGSIPSNLPTTDQPSPNGSQLMDRQHLSTAELLTIDPKIRCFDCNKRLLDSADHETWTKAEANYFCAQCSVAEEIEATPTEQVAMEEAQSNRNRPW